MGPCVDTRLLPTFICIKPLVDGLHLDDQPRRTTVSTFLCSGLQRTLLEQYFSW